MKVCEVNQQYREVRTWSMGSGQDFFLGQISRWIFVIFKNFHGGPEVTRCYAEVATNWFRLIGKPRRSSAMLTSTVFWPLCVKTYSLRPLCAPSFSVYRTGSSCYVLASCNSPPTCLHGEDDDSRRHDPGSILPAQLMVDVQRIQVGLWHHGSWQRAVGGQYHRRAIDSRTTRDVIHGVHPINTNSRNINIPCCDDYPQFVD